MRKIGRPRTRIPEDLIAPAEMAARLGISRSGLQGMIERGTIPCFRLGARVWFSERMVAADMQRQAADRLRGRLARYPTDVLIAEIERRQRCDEDQGDLPRVRQRDLHGGGLQPCGAN